MPSTVYGASDDLIEFGGDFVGECGGGDDPKLVILSDGTMLSVRYGKNDEAIWEVNCIKKGSLFDRIEICDNEDAEPYSDVAHFKDGISWAYAAAEWERVD